MENRNQDPQPIWWSKTLVSGEDFPNKTNRSKQAELRSLCGALLCPTVKHRISAAEVGCRMWNRKWNPRVRCHVNHPYVGMVNIPPRYLWWWLGDGDFPMALLFYPHEPAEKFTDVIDTLSCNGGIWQFFLKATCQLDSARPIWTTFPDSIQPIF